MDGLVAAAQAAEPTSAGYRELHERLSKAEPMLVRAHADILTALATLSPAAHSLAYCHFLAAKAKHPGTGAQRSAFINIARNFFGACNTAQIRTAPAQFACVSRALASLSIEQGDTLLSLLPLRQAATKLAEDPSTLTPCHVDFVQVAIVAKAYKCAGKLLDNPVFSVLKQKKVLSSEDVVLFFYYGGMVYTGLKQFEKAIEFYKMCIGTPASMISAVVVEAAKKLILVSLIARGKTADYLPCTPAVVTSGLSSMLTTYSELASVYKTLNPSALGKTTQAHFELFNADSNWGLVKQVVQSLTRRKILRLTNAYITRSLDDIAAAAGLSTAAEAESMLLEMIERRDIVARIDKSNGMVSFSDDPEEFDNAAMALQLDSEIRETMALADRVSSLDAVVAMTEAYAKRVAALEHPELARGTGAGGAGAGGSTSASGGTGWEDDSDMMAADAFTSADLLGGLGGPTA